MTDSRVDQDGNDFSGFRHIIEMGLLIGIIGFGITALYLVISHGF